MERKQLLLLLKELMCGCGYYTGSSILGLSLVLWPDFSWDLHLRLDFPGAKYDLSQLNIHFFRYCFV